MIITLVSGFLNHHQLALCKELMANCDEFYYIATEKMPEERARLGYKDSTSAFDFVIDTCSPSYKKGTAEEVILKSDAVIFGTCPDSFIELRMGENRLSFLYSERFFKKGTWRRFIPTTRRKIHNRILKYKDKNLYVLSASAFLPYDLKLLSFPSEKCLRWGYFPEADDLSSYPQRKSQELNILWAGRMIPYKRPEDAVMGALKLRENGIDFTLDFVGEGEEKKKLEALVKAKGLEASVIFSGTMSPEKVREKMRSADVFLMTSDYNEGWGAVINEAMSEGCALLASSAVGSVPYLIEDGKSGLIYRFGDQKDFENKLLKLAKDKNLREALGKEAFRFLREDYSPQVAAKRLAEFISSKSTPWESGPMSEAPVIKNKWY